MFSLTHSFRPSHPFSLTFLLTSSLKFPLSLLFSVFPLLSFSQNSSHAFFTQEFSQPLSLRICSLSFSQISFYLSSLRVLSHLPPQNSFSVSTQNFLTLSLVQNSLFSFLLSCSFSLSFSQIPSHPSLTLPTHSKLLKDFSHLSSKFSSPPIPFTLSQFPHSLSTLNSLSLLSGPAHLPSLRIPSSLSLTLSLHLTILLPPTISHRISCPLLSEIP